MRDTWKSPLPRPTTSDWDEVINARTVRAFAQEHGLDENRVSEWRRGIPCHWALWELILMRENMHPSYRVNRRRTA